MRTDNIIAELQAEFSRANVNEWEKIATQELKGKNPLEILSWRGKDDLLFLPYYDAASHASISSATRIQSAAEKNFRSNNWLNLPLIVSDNEETANSLALEHLLQGADGIIFDLKSGHCNLNKLTSNIEWPHCYTGFVIKDDTRTLDSLTRVLLSVTELSTIHGGLFWETIPKNDSLDYYLNGNESFKSLGIFLADQTPCLQIANALMQGVELVDDLSNKYALHTVFSAIAFSVTADAYLLETIAKLRALRRLWFQVAQAYGLGNYKTSDLFLHVRVPEVQDGSYGPHQNMLNGTFASLAAVLGGCDALSVESQHTSNQFSRWARNVSLILKEESLMVQAADPFAGAWSVESMTDRMAQHSWQLFQQKWRDYATT